jgi:hypothetical protein
MAIASITSWLNSPDKNYILGRALYQQYGSDPVTLALINSGSTAYHFNKLFQALTELNKKVGLEPKQIVIGDFHPEPVSSPSGKSNPDFAGAPEKILQIREEKNRRFAQARKLHESIRLMDSREHRLKAAVELLNHMDFVNECWSIIDEWRDHGHVRHQEEIKQAADVSDLTEAQLIREKTNLASNITKDRAKLQACKDPRKQVKLSQRLQARTIRLEQIRRRLSEFV